MKGYKKKTMKYGMVIVLMGLLLAACDKSVENKVTYQVAVRNELAIPIELSVYQGETVREGFNIKPDSIRVVFSRSSKCNAIGPNCIPFAPLPFTSSDSVVLLMNDRQKVYRRSEIPFVGDPMDIASLSNRDPMSYELYTYGKSAHPDGGYSVEVLHRSLNSSIDTHTYVYRVTDSLYAASIPIAE